MDWRRRRLLVGLGPIGGATLAGRSTSSEAGPDEPSVTSATTTAGDGMSTTTSTTTLTPTGTSTSTGPSAADQQVARANTAADDAEDLFGWAVSDDGTSAVVGAPKDEDPNGPGAGSVCVFA